MLVDTKKIVVIGATNNRADPANQAVRAFLERDYKVFPVNPDELEVEGLRCFHSLAEIHEPVALAAFYVPPSEGLRYVHGLRALRVRKVFLHPAAASGRLILIAQGHQHEVEAVDAIRALERSVASA